MSPSVQVLFWLSMGIVWVCMMFGIQAIRKAYLEDKQRVTKAKLYYEAHVTIEPVFDEARERADVLAQKHGFKLAKLLMQKRQVDVAERSKFDTFMTGHDTILERITERTSSLVTDLRAAGFTVWRYKLEDTLLDSRTRDELNLLGDLT